MQNEFEKRVPNSPEAEASALGAMLQSKDAISLAAERLREEFFYTETHRKLFKAILELYEKNSEVDAVTLSEQLKIDGAMEEVGGLPFIYEISGAVPTAANVEFHSEIIRSKYILREVINRCTAIIQEAYQPVDNVDSFVNWAEERVLEIQSFRLKGGFERLKPLIRNFVEDLDERTKGGGGILGLPTGFKGLDDRIGGLQKSDLIVIAGRPSTGKTALVLNVALNVAGITVHQSTKVPVGIFSLEMSKQQVIQRFICADAGLSLRKLRIAKLSDDDWSKITHGANELFECPIFVDDSFSLSAVELRAKARRLFKQEKIGLLIVDYLQLMTTKTADRSRQEEVSQISRALKAVAKELDIPVIAVSQLSRAVESRTDRKPRLSDLRESGAIEQDADLVLMLYRPELAEVHTIDNQSTEGLTEVIIAKNRNGPTGSVDLYFTKEFTRFSDLSKREEPSMF